MQDVDLRVSAAPLHPVLKAGRAHACGVCVLPCGGPAAGGVVCVQTSPATLGLRALSLGGLPGARVEAGG